jgi:monoterpene epsilon-lactone hydrolase
MAVSAAMRSAEAAAPLPTIVGSTVTVVDAGGVGGVLVTPEGVDSNRTVLYLHGGGYLFLTTQSHVAVMAALAAESGAACLGIDYRRAPEDRFPAPVEDAVTAYRWLLDSGHRPDAIALAGDSAGGGLVLSLLIALRDQGLSLPAAAVCFSPWTDLSVTGPSADSAPDPVVGGTALRMMAAAYLDGVNSSDPLASPLYADLHGLPPLQIQVGGREALLDDARRFAERALEAGVAVTYLEHPGVIHMWIVFGPDVPESKEAFTKAGSFLSDHLHRGGGTSAEGHDRR